MNTQLKHEADLPLVVRAANALGLASLEPTLIALAKESATITAITNQTGYSQLHSARIKLKNTRVDIQKKGKAARDDANAFAKAVIKEENRLLELIEPEENRLANIQGEWDAARERERQAEIDAENARVARIQTAIDEIRALPMEASGKTSAHALSVLAEAEALVLTEAEYQEGFQTAQTALYTSIVAIKGVVAERQAAEAEQARIVAERAELARLRAADEERQRQESIRVAQERAAERAETERLQAIARAAQDKADAAQREADRQTAELERQRRVADEARLQEDLRVQALQEAETQRLADERAELERQQQALIEAKKPKPLPAKGKRPTDADIVSVLALHYRVHESKVVEWLLEVDLNNPELSTP